jgi:thiol-disulfide isomerase/thioredoxin
MTLTAEKFSQGMSVQGYIDQIRVNKTPFQEIYRAVQVPRATQDFFDGLKEPMRLAVFTADWCGDALSTTPAILRLAESTPNLPVRVFNRDDELDLTNSFLPEHRHSTVPVFVVLDRRMAEVARFIETARSLVPHLEAMHQEIAQQVASQGAPGARAAAGGRRTAFRVAHARQWGQIILREFQEVVAQGLALPPARRPAEGGTQWPPPEETPGDGGDDAGGKGA